MSFGEPEIGRAPRRSCEPGQSLHGEDLPGGEVEHRLKDQRHAVSLEHAFDPAPGLEISDRARTQDVRDETLLDRQVHLECRRDTCVELRRREQGLRDFAQFRGGRDHHADELGELGQDCDVAVVERMGPGRGDVENADRLAGATQRYADGRPNPVGSTQLQVNPGIGVDVVAAQRLARP